MKISKDSKVGFALVVRVPDRWVRDGHCFEIGLNQVTLG